MYEEGDVILDFFGRDLGFVEICVCFFLYFFYGQRIIYVDR